MKRLNTSTILAAALACIAVAESASSEDRPLSAAMRRHTADDSENELYTRFRYQPIKGLGYEPGVHRRDPSTIIKVDDRYCVWYTHCTDPRYKWLNADIWYATSRDGHSWTERGPAVERGPKGAWDDFSVFTTNVLVAEGKYYLCYQARSFSSGRNVVGMAKADSPAGPWTKLPEPILRTTPDGKLVDANSGYANWSRYEEKPQRRRGTQNPNTLRLAEPERSKKSGIKLL